MEFHGNVRVYFVLRKLSSEPTKIRHTFNGKKRVALKIRGYASERSRTNGKTASVKWFWIKNPLWLVFSKQEMQNSITKHVEYKNLVQNEPLCTDQTTNHTNDTGKHTHTHTIQQHEIIQSYCIASIYRFR